jgi:hypothetical protein
MQEIFIVYIAVEIYSILTPENMMKSSSDAIQEMSLAEYCWS